MRCSGIRGCRGRPVPLGPFLPAPCRRRGGRPSPAPAAPDGRRHGRGRRRVQAAPGARCPARRPAGLRHAGLGGAPCRPRMGDRAGCGLPLPLLHLLPRPLLLPAAPRRGGRLVGLLAGPLRRRGRAQLCARRVAPVRRVGRRVQGPRVLAPARPHRRGRRPEHDADEHLLSVAAGRVASRAPGRRRDGACGAPVRPVGPRVGRAADAARHAHGRRRAGRGRAGRPARRPDVRPPELPRRAARRRRRALSARGNGARARRRPVHVEPGRRVPGEPRVRRRHCRALVGQRRLARL